MQTVIKTFLSLFYLLINKIYSKSKATNVSPKRISEKNSSKNETVLSRDSKEVILQRFA